MYPEPVLCQIDDVDFQLYCQFEKIATHPVRLLLVRALRDGRADERIRSDVRDCLNARVLREIQGS
jgi:hypothetical protein